jgi:hypothetical protein
MSLGDTFTVALATGGSKVLNRVDDSESMSATYYLYDTTQEFTVKVRHQKTKSGRWRHNRELTWRVFETSSASEINRLYYDVIERDPSDFELEHIDAMADWLIASSNDNVTALMGLNS